MPSRDSVSYFGAGPAPLPTPVLEDAAAALVNYEDTGLGLAEISHRSPTATKILNGAKQNLFKLLDIPDDYDILFMQGGGSGQFSAIVQNLVSRWIELRRQSIAARLNANADSDEVVAELQKNIDEELRLDYLVTGSWSVKAAQEAERLVGSQHVNIATDFRKTNANGNFAGIAAEDTWNLTPTKSEGGKSAPAFVYFCDNETVDGVEFPSFPKRLEQTGSDADDERLIIADMSSNILSRKIDVNKYGIIYAGAQKNSGIAGITLVIIKKSLLSPAVPTSILQRLSITGLPTPVTYDYATTAKNNSLYNTLPIFNLYVAGAIIERLVQQFGTISGQEAVVRRKVEKIYSVLDKYPESYTVVPERAVRSRMNICFRVNKAEDGSDREGAFFAEAEKRALLGIKGHRSVGGCRISNYNAVTEESVDKLTSFLDTFGKRE